MYKKIISVMSVALMVFLCSAPVFAEGTNPPADYFTQNWEIAPNVYEGIELTAFRPMPYLYVDNYADPVYWKFEVIGRVNINTGLSYGANVFFDNSNAMRFHISTISGSNQTQTKNWVLTDAEYLGGHIGIRSIDENNNITFEPYPYNTYIDQGVNFHVPTYGYLYGYFKLTFVGFALTGSDVVLPQFGASTVYRQNATYSVVQNDDPVNDFGYIPDIYHSLVDSYNRLGVIDSHLIDILNAYNSNVPASQGLTNESSQASSTIDNQHQTESNYFSNSQTAIQDTGIQNFQFSSQELGGLNGLKDDFTAVWTACGSLSRYWIASLTIGLALAIIRHRRMFKSD